jgi:hypothetical protein
MLSFRAKRGICFSFRIHKPSAHHHTPRKLYVAIPLIARSRVHQRDIGTHKNYVRLVYCPIYSVVKYRPHRGKAKNGFCQLTCLSRLELFAASFRFQPKDQVEFYFWSSSNPMFGAKRLALNRDTESVAALTPNIRLTFLQAQQVLQGLFPASTASR